MNRSFWWPLVVAWLGLAVVYGCGPTDPGLPDAGNGGSGGRGGADACKIDGDCPIDNNLCHTPTCSEGVCSYLSKPDGSICQGTSRDPIHGECVNDGCDVTEWTCIHSPPGTACIGGLCDDFGLCCTGCITDGGGCKQNCGITGGGACPVAGCP